MLCWVQGFDGACRPSHVFFLFRFTGAGKNLNLKNILKYGPCGRILPGRECGSRGAGGRAPLSGAAGRREDRDKNSLTLTLACMGTLSGRRRPPQPRATG